LPACIGALTTLTDLNLGRNRLHDASADKAAPPDDAPSTFDVLSSLRALTELVGAALLMTPKLIVRLRVCLQDLDENRLRRVPRVISRLTRLEVR
jgi:hypothetical protein